MLLFAPQSDDEAIGCSGVILQALAQGARVKVASFTNGDGFPAAAALAGKPVERLNMEDFFAFS